MSDAKKLLERWESGEVNAAQFMDQAPEAMSWLLVQADYAEDAIRGLKAELDDTRQALAEAENAAHGADEKAETA